MSQFNREAISRRVRQRCGGVEHTKQSMRDSCDINNIMGRYLRSGTVDHLAVHGGSYGFASSATFKDAMNVVRKAEEMFETLDSGLRKRFGNSPAAFLDYVQARDADGQLSNLREMRSLGLALPEKAPEPLPRFVMVDEAGKPIVAPGAPGGARAPGTVLP